ncbi:hypothetical protein BDN72DRAFT_838171 [Pluteus cervinus]|uniref:Uncharacterized protein n=1 Tax=Pluteus cervinus TaxID=181527 RepID=A0ACD3AZA5_9AGAR|nr:hypothetical protein BDN72DRAFT_838171 [Pluteus cervinus]
MYISSIIGPSGQSFELSLSVGDGEGSSSASNTSGGRERKVIWDAPVVLVEYGDRKMFLKKEREYSNMINLITSKFDISNRDGLGGEDVPILVLKTSSLDVCRNQDVEVDESAYEHLFQVLDQLQLEVKVVPHVQQHQVLVTPKPEPREVEIPAAPAGPDVGTPSSSRTRGVRGTPRSQPPETPSSGLGRQATTGRVCTVRDYSPSPKKAGPSSSDRENECLTPKAQPSSDQENEYLTPKARPARGRAKARKGREATPLGSSSSHNVNNGVDDDEDSAFFTSSTARKNLNETSTKPSNTSGFSVTKVQDQGLRPEGDHFVVYVRGPHSDHNKDLRVLPSHSIQRIFADACRDWRLDMTRARLCWENVGDATFEDLEYDEGSTMAHVGVGENATLHIKMDGED